MVRRRASRFAAVALGAALTATSSAAPPERGDPAPACPAVRLDDGRALSIADYRGRVVYLDFWASWCAPCRESFPFMGELDREFRDKGLAVVAVSVDKTVDDARRFLVRYPARFDLAIDVTAACPAAYALPGMPSTYLVDRAGVIRAVHAGFHPSEESELRRMVQEALARP